MSFARGKWAGIVVFVLAVGMVGGCATSSSSQRGAVAERSSSKSADSRTAESKSDEPAFEKPLAARFAGPVSLYGELVRRESAPRRPLSNSDNLRQVTSTREGADFDVTVDPAGEWLCFASTRHTRTANLYLRQVDGSTVTQLTSDSGNDAMPAFSPDGNYVAFASDRSGTWNIYLKPVEGGKAIQITDDPSQEMHPSFSPDGSQLVFSALSNRSGQWEMVVVDVDNPSKRRFIGFGLFPSFSPDGEKIAFQRARQRGSRTFSVWTIDYEDGEGSRPTEIAAAGNAAVITPAWSPDGERLAFATVMDPARRGDGARPDQAELWMIDVDGTNRVRLTQDMFANLQPAWSSDGVIYFISNRTGYDNVWSLKPTESPVFADQLPAAEVEQQASVPTE